MMIRTSDHGPGHRLGRMIFSCLALALASCAHAAPPIRPCVELSPEVVPPNPCAVADSDCGERLAFVRRMAASTVNIHVTSYDAAAGVTYRAGTGTVIDGRGTVLTAYHVVRDPLREIVVVGTRRLHDDGSNFVSLRHVPMTVVAVEPTLDVALLQPAVSGERLPAPLPLRRSPAPSVGDRLWHFGHVSHWQYGTVVRVDQSNSGIAGLTEVDFSCRHGDSGGPFVTPAGELVGVLLSMSGSVDGRGTTFFLPLDDALDALGYP